MAFKKMENYKCFDLVKNELEDRQAADTYLQMVTNLNVQAAVLSTILQRIFVIAHFTMIEDSTQIFDYCN